MARKAPCAVVCMYPSTNHHKQPYTRTRYMHTEAHLESPDVSRRGSRLISPLQSLGLLAAVMFGATLSYFSSQLSFAPC
jgi:hypothetical protein